MMVIGDLPDDLVDQLFHEIDFGSDRATAIVLAAFVEDHLTQFIRSRLIKDDRLQQKMFGPGGAMGDFGTKVNIGYLFGFYSGKAWKELDTIRRIRNDFAHNLRTISFNVASVKDRCAQLTLWENLKITLRSVDPSSADAGVELDELHGDPADPKQRYVNACRFYMAMFTFVVRQKRDLPEPIF